MVDYEISGDTFQSLILHLNQGETISTDPYRLFYMTDGVRIRTGARGGFFKALARKLWYGEKFFQTSYESVSDDQKLALKPNKLGKILHIELKAGNKWALKDGAYMAHLGEIDVKPKLQELKAGFFGGQSFILQTVSASKEATIFLETDGDVVKYELKPREELTIDSKHLVAYDTDKLEFDVGIHKPKGFLNKIKTWLFGQGLIRGVIKAGEEGGTVYLQTSPPPAHAINRNINIYGGGHHDKNPSHDPIPSAIGMYNK